MSEASAPVPFLCVAARKIAAYRPAYRRGQVPNPQKWSAMNIPSTIADYLRRCSQELGERILHDYPALQAPGDPISDRFNSLLRTPFAAQRLAVMGIVKRWNRATDPASAKAPFASNHRGVVK